MKWINLAERQPNKEDVVIRNINSKLCFDWMLIRKITPEFITATVNEEFGDDDFPSNEYEWLDESEDKVEEGMVVIQVPAGSYVVTPDKMKIILFISFVLLWLSPIYSRRGKQAA